VIYDLQGRRIRSFGHVGGGAQRIHWDGTDDDNHPVAAGVYFARLIIGRESRTIRLLRSR
jgi:hypothetical protein